VAKGHGAGFRTESGSGAVAWRRVTEPDSARSASMGPFGRASMPGRVVATTPPGTDAAEFGFGTSALRVATAPNSVGGTAPGTPPQAAP
jgi:hypothetical protein